MAVAIVKDSPNVKINNTVESVILQDFESLEFDSINRNRFSCYSFVSFLERPYRKQYNYIKCVFGSRKNNNKRS